MTAVVGFPLASTMVSAASTRTNAFPSETPIPYPTLESDRVSIRGPGGVYPPRRIEPTPERKTPHLSRVSRPFDKRCFLRDLNNRRRQTGESGLCRFRQDPAAGSSNRAARETPTPTGPVWYSEPCGGGSSTPHAKREPRTPPPKRYRRDPSRRGRRQR